MGFDKIGRSRLVDERFNALVLGTLALEQVFVFWVLANLIVLRHPENVTLRLGIGRKQRLKPQLVNLRDRRVGGTDARAVVGVKGTGVSVDPTAIAGHIGLYLIQTLHRNPNFDVPGSGVMDRTLEQVLGPGVNMVFVLHALPLIRRQILLPEFLKGLLPFELILNFP